MSKRAGYRRPTQVDTSAGPLESLLRLFYGSGITPLSPNHPSQKLGRMMDAGDKGDARFTPEAEANRKKQAAAYQKGLLNNPEYQQALAELGEGTMDFSGGLLGTVKKVKALTKNPMVVQHNLHSGSLERADRAGGLPMPSIAISKADSPLTSFGDVSLLGGPEMAKPSAKNPVYAADAYTVRSPEVELVPNEKSIELVKKFYNIDYQYGDAVAKGVAEQILTKQGHAPQDYGVDIKKSFLKSKGISVGKPKSNKYQDRQEHYINVDNKLNKYLNGNGYDLFFNWLTKQKNKLIKQGGGFSERIFRGFTNQGNRRYAPANLDNVVKEMKSLEKQRGATGADMVGSLGNVRSKVTPRFKSLFDVKKSRDKIVSKKDFDVAKGDMEQKYANFQGLIYDFLERNPEYSSTPIRTTDELTSDMIMGRSSKDWFPYGIPENIKIEAGKLRAELKEMPTEYFEIKPKRGVKLSEFEGAIIPQDASKTVEPILKKAGIKKILQYGSDEERKTLFKRFPELMFTVPVLGAGLSNTDSR